MHAKQAYVVKKVENGYLIYPVFESNTIRLADHKIWVAGTMKQVAQMLLQLEAHEKPKTQLKEDLRD